VSGIYLYFSEENMFFHNNLINNAEQVRLYSYTGQNTWDNGCEGNYWSDYWTGVDLDLDGIGDKPYVIGQSNIDNNPLMNLYWNPCDINHDLIVGMQDLDKAAKAYGSQPGGPLWNPHADITGPEHLAPDNRVDMRDIGLIGRNFGEMHL
jgi:hypothetical protein